MQIFHLVKLSVVLVHVILILSHGEGTVVIPFFYFGIRLLAFLLSDTSHQKKKTKERKLDK